MQDALHWQKQDCGDELQKLLGWKGFKTPEAAERVQSRGAALVAAISMLKLMQDSEYPAMLGSCLVPKVSAPYTRGLVPHLSNTFQHPGSVENCTTVFEMQMGTDAAGTTSRAVDVIKTGAIVCDGLD